MVVSVSDTEEVKNELFAEAMKLSSYNNQGVLSDAVWDMNGCALIFAHQIKDNPIVLDCWQINATDETNTHTFKNTLIEDLNMSRYKDSIRYISGVWDKQDKVGDIVITMNSERFKSSRGYLTYYSFVFCVADGCNNIGYQDNFFGLFSDDKSFEDIRKVRNFIIKFIDKFY